LWNQAQVPPVTALRGDDDDIGAVLHVDQRGRARALGADVVEQEHQGRERDAVTMTPLVAR